MIKASSLSQSSLSLKLLLLLAIIISSIAIYLNLYSSIRLDEAQSLWAATKSLGGIFEYIAQDVHVPLYSILLSFWVQFFGTDIVVIRLLSVLFFVLSIPALYIMARSTANQRVAIIATSLYCLSPFLTWYSTESRMYTLLTFWTILSHISFLRLFRSKAKESKLFYLLVSVLGLYSHYFFAMIIALQALYYFLNFLDKSNQAKIFSKKYWVSLFDESKRSGLFSYLLLVVSILLLFLPWVVYVLQQGGAADTKPLLSPPTSYNILQLFIHFFTGFQSTTVQSSLVSLWPLVVVLLFLSFTHKKKLVTLHTNYYFMVTFIPIILAFIASYLIQPMLVSRYLIFITPTLFYLLAILLNHFNKVTFSIVLTIVFLSNFFFQTQQALSSQITEREDYYAVAEYLNQRVSEEDVVVVSVPFTVYPIEYHYQGRAKIETIPQWNRYEFGSIPPFSVEELTQQITTYQDQYQRAFVVLSYDQGYEQEIEQFFDNSYHMNSIQEFSPSLEVREYKLQYND